MNKAIVLLLVLLAISLNYFSSMNINKSKNQKEIQAQNPKSVLNNAGDSIDTNNEDFTAIENNDIDKVLDLWQFIKETTVLDFDKDSGFNAQIPAKILGKENQIVEITGVGLMIESGVSNKKVVNFILIPFSNAAVCCESIIMEPMAPEHIVFVECSNNSFEIPNNFCCIIKCTGELKIQKPNPHKLIYQIQNAKLEIISTNFSEITEFLKSSNKNFCKLPIK